MSRMLTSAYMRFRRRFSSAIAFAVRSNRWRLPLTLTDQARIHAAILGAPFVQRGAAHAMFEAQLGSRNAALHLAQHAHDLSF